MDDEILPTAEELAQLEAEEAAAWNADRERERDALHEQYAAEGRCLEVVEDDSGLFCGKDTPCEDHATDEEWEAGI